MCTSDKHEADKLNPSALAAEYEAHDKPWVLGDDVLLMFTCKRCHSTICIPGSE